VLSLRRKPLDRAAKWIEAQRTEWSARLEALDAVLKTDRRATSNIRKKKGTSK
jgi:hypothetical protein